MSEDTARQEVEKVCFAYEKAGKTGNKKDWGKFYDLEEPLIKKVEFANQPKLSIPKKIAELLDQEIVADDITKFAMFHEGFERLWLSDDLTKYCMDYKNYALASVYLAGKALGIELVEVSDE